MAKYINCTITTIASKQTKFHHEIKGFAQVDFTRGRQQRCFTLSFSTLMHLSIAGLTMHQGIVSWANDSWVHLHIIIATIQGRQKRSGCSGLARPVFCKVKMKFNFYKKQIFIKSAIVIFGLIRLIILDMARYGDTQLSKNQEVTRNCGNLITIGV